jgi:hypothetical protein
MRYQQKGTPPRVAEPVQVYLNSDEQDRLKRLTEHLATSKSDVLRRGLEALEREVTDPAGHPVLRVIGIGASSEPEGRAPALDPARDHDTFLTGSEERSWTRGARRRDEGADADDPGSDREGHDGA